MLISYELDNSEDFGRQVATVTNEVATSANLPLGAELQVLSLHPQPDEVFPIMLGTLIMHAPKIHELEIIINDLSEFDMDDLRELLEALSDTLPRPFLTRYTVHLMSPGIEDHWDVLIDIIANNNTDLRTKLNIHLGMPCFGHRDTIEGLFNSLSQQNTFRTVSIKTSEIEGDAVNDIFVIEGAPMLLRRVAWLTFTNAALSVTMELPMTTVPAYHTEMQRAFNRALRVLVGPRTSRDNNMRRTAVMSFNPADYIVSTDDEEDEEGINDDEEGQGNGDEGQGESVRDAHLNNAVSPPVLTPAAHAPVTESSLL